MAYLFNTDAISELFRPQPAPAYVEWLRSIPRGDQFTSAVVIGELYRGAFRSPARERHLVNIRQRVLPAVTVLPYDVAVAEVCGLLSAQLERGNKRLLTRIFRSQQRLSITTWHWSVGTLGISLAFLNFVAPQCSRNPAYQLRLENGLLNR